MKNIVLLGSTGSIGTQTLDVVSTLSCGKLLALTTNQNIDLLEQQILAYHPQKAVVQNAQLALELKHRMQGKKTEILQGNAGLLEVSAMQEANVVVNALVGNVGLAPTMAAIKAGKRVALANKETLVAAGELVMKAAKANNVSIYPIDSEHSAIFQCLLGNEAKSVQKIYLTASGGPFRTKTQSELEHVTLAQALAHPNWQMGKKISIDSATMMNKGLEVIEAKWLFDMPLDRISVLVHPQSVVHSMVEFCDGSVMAQLGEPDMRVPISLAINFPTRLTNPYPRLDFSVRNQLTFEPPNFSLFPCLSLAFSAIKQGGNLPAVLNAANEQAVCAFLNGNITFLDIPKLVEKALSAYPNTKEHNLETVEQADIFARTYVNSNIY